jgi:amino acid adenylation domain-containing protein
LIGMPVANRDTPEVEALIGHFANTLVVRSRVDEDASFARVLADIQATTVAVHEHQVLPFEALADELLSESNLSYNPLFQVMFACRERLVCGDVPAGLTVEARVHTNPSAKFDLHLEVQDQPDGLDLRLTYNRDLFAATTAQRFLDHYLLLLEQMLVDPGQAVATIPLVTPAQERRMRAAWDATVVDTPWRRPLHKLFEEQVAKTPDRIALISADVRLTYAELNHRANRLARHLGARGAGPGTAIGVHLDTSADTVVALLAILKTGGAYVPMDPSYPAERIAYIAQDTQVPLAVTTTALAEKLNLPAVCLDADWPEIIRQPADDGVSQESDGDSLIYVMYTSGSTGKPKGVMVPHRSASNYVLWMRRRFGLSPDDKVLVKSSINFDVSVWEIFLPLISGAQAVIGRPAELRSPDTLADIIRREAVTDVQFVPSALRTLVDAGVLRDCTSLKRIFCGGEALTLKLTRDVFAIFAGELHNLYGPTEVSVYSCHWSCRSHETMRSVPVGGPIDNTRIYILDAEGRPVPDGIPGEICIGGVAVTLGYLNKPEATARGFAPDPFVPGGRMYRTGDLGRWGTDGVIEFLGRRDRQIKVRGIRIEPGEIEHLLSTHPRVKHAIVVVREDVPDDVRLTAYVLDSEGGGAETAELRAHLTSKLPPYMVPSIFVRLDSLPLLPNNKIDYAALPKPEATKSTNAGRQANFASDLERQLAAIWEDVLGTSDFGPEDSFFAVGGHSLLIAKLRLLIEEKLGLPVSNVDLFQFPTIAGLAHRLTRTGNPAVARIAADMSRRAQMRARTRTRTPVREVSS